MSLARISLLIPFLTLLVVPPALATEVAAQSREEHNEFTPEEMARVIYLYSRLGRARDAEKISKDYLRENSRDRNVLLVLCALYAEQGRHVVLNRAARRYLKYYPGDAQGMYYLSASEFMAGHYTEAVKILRDIRKHQPKDSRELFLTDMAADTWLMGDWTASLEAHLELIRNQQLSPQLEHALRRQLDEIYRKHLDRVSVGAVTAIFDTGIAVRPEVEHESQVSQRSRLRINYAGDYVSLRDRSPILGGSHYRQQAAVALEYTHDTLWRTEYAVGAWEKGALAGFRLDYERRGKRAAWLKADYNARALDSLALEAMNGRRHEVGVGFTQRFNQRTALTVAPYVYRTELEGHELGHGAGVQWRLAQTIFAGGPAVTVGLRGTYDEFHAVDKNIDPKDVIDASVAPSDRISLLVAPRFNRQGIDLETTGIIGSPNLYRVFTSLDYDFERDDIVWGIGGELTHRPRKSIDLTMRTEYSTSGNRANADSGAFILSASATFRY